MSTTRATRKIVTVLMPAMIVITSCPAVAGVKRLVSIPQPLWGAWAPNADACSNATDESIVVLSAKSYRSSRTSCNIIDLSETPGTNGPVYSARSRCTKQGQTQPTISNLIVRTEDSNRISIGSDFTTLKMHQKCSANEPITERTR